MFLQIGEQVDVDEQPVGENDEALDAPVQQHFEVALETAALIVNIRENRQERRLVQGVLNAAKHQRAIRVGHVENHDANRVAAPAAQRARKQVGAVTKLRGGALDAPFGSVGNVACQRRVVQDDGN